MIVQADQIFDHGTQFGHQPDKVDLEAGMVQTRRAAKEVVFRQLLGDFTKPNMDIWSTFDSRSALC